MNEETKARILKGNGGFCWICDANHSSVITADGRYGICAECAEEMRQHALKESRN